MNKNHRITAAEAREMMRKNSGAVVLDVRTPDEFATGKIPGALLLPDYTIRERAETELPDKNRLILVYCRSGVRSREAVYELESLGYTDVYDFGGINAWPFERE
jgi:rhodanese-related sulfurtransferase